jgi:sugar lactone lactonase YvrE
MNEVHLFRRSGAILAESLVWDAESRSLRWCDITTGALIRSGLNGPQSGEKDDRLQLPAPLGSFHPARDGFVASLADRVVVVDADGTILRQLAEIAHQHAGMRLNDGRVDAEGRWITGSADVTRHQPDGAYYSVTEDGARLLFGGVGVANGLDWSPDGRRIYFTDSSVGSIYTATYTRGGEIKDVASFHHGAPHDGLVVDLDGCIWTAEYGRGRVTRLDREGKEVLSIPLPVPNVTSVTFGGDAMSTLFVASARENLSERELAAHPLSGSIFAIDTATVGRAARVFG